MTGIKMGQVMLIIANTTCTLLGFSFTIFAFALTGFGGQPPMLGGYIILFSVFAVIILSWIAFYHLIDLNYDHSIESSMFKLFFHFKVVSFVIPGILYFITYFLTN